MPTDNTPTSTPQDVLAHFPDLTPRQREQIAALGPLYREWNAKINVVSRKDIADFYLHHVLHSLAIARAMPLAAGWRVLDLGTGGGLPGIPLAIVSPQCQFTLIDSIGKKVRVATEVARATGLDNVRTLHERAEEERGHYDLVVSRAVMPLADLARLTRKNTRHIVCLKGGDLTAELAEFRSLPFAGEVSAEPVAKWFADPWFEQKYVVQAALN